MSSYARYIPEYLRKLVRRTAVGFGVVTLIAVYAVARYLFDAEQPTILKIELGVFVFVFVESAYGVFKAERAKRAAYESEIRLSGRPSSLEWNLGDVPKDEIRLKLLAKIELWSDVDFDTTELTLNLVGFRQRSRRNLWLLGLPETKRLVGLPPHSQDTRTYRRQYRTGEQQPFTDSVMFEWQGPLDWRDEVEFELVLKFGRPNLTLRTTLDRRLGERGSTKPA